MGERRGPSRVAGPSDAGAAMTMGNSLEMWDRVYDTNFKARDAPYMRMTFKEQGWWARWELVQGSLSCWLRAPCMRWLWGSLLWLRSPLRDLRTHRRLRLSLKTHMSLSQSMRTLLRGEEPRRLRGSMEVGYEDSPVEGEEEEEEEEWEDDDVVVEL